MKITEEQIPLYIKQGEDRHVIKLLYKKVYPLVKKTILKNGGRKEDADDVFQDAIIILYKQIVKDVFNPKYKVFGYLYRLSINYWINKIKRDKKVTFVEDFSDNEPFQETIKEEPLNLNENILKSLFGGIGEKCVELLTYTVFYDLLMEDIMIRMGFPSIDAVKMQAQRCKKKIIKEIENNPLLAERLRRNEN